MGLPLANQWLEQAAAELEASEPALTDEALEHAIWLLAQLRADGARELEITPDGDLIAYVPSGSYSGPRGIPLEPAAWAREIAATARQGRGA